MKTIFHPRALSPRKQAGFTLAEISVAAGVFSLLVLGLICSNLFGLRMFNLMSSKLSASAYSRTALNDTRNDIRSAKMLYVGTGDSTNFARIMGNSLRQGTALQIYPTTDTNVYVRYYLDTTGQKLKRVVSGSGVVTTVASSVTNQVPFAVEDFAGNTLTNDQDNRVVKMYLEFCQGAGAQALVDASRVQTRITRRAIE